MMQQYRFQVFIPELQSGSRRATRTLMFAAASFTTAKIQTQTKYPAMDEWIKAVRCTHTVEY